MQLRTDRESQIRGKPITEMNARRAITGIFTPARQGINSLSQDPSHFQQTRGIRVKEQTHHMKNSENGFWLARIWSVSSDRRTTLASFR
ncbi:hypothetical protein F3Y22_tig00002237pilonHSYRG00199 [Hibiscus syriacus]|uniref:Uncharacterized protein n=1 Tax=Hibiscus syriacus TaxID=106335 RepID=A0A6A3CXR1_HIBSY|nr:hypothetical protein F3Y22_tig00002237pilonHSYRG00199 [Hibiscus syriacus]